MTAKPLPALTESDKARFFSKIQKNPGPDGCWIWKEFKTTGGYGQFFCQGRIFYAHRISHVIHGGTFDDGPLVIHGPCNNRACVNPAHLTSGDDKKNHADQKRDGTKPSGSRHYSRSNPDRLARGGKNGSAKLQESHIVAIRQRYAAGGTTLANLGDEFGVSGAMISRIVSRKLWSHVA